MNKKYITDFQSNVIIYVQSLIIDCSYNKPFNIYDYLNIKVPQQLIESWSSNNPIPFICEAECTLMSNNKQICPSIVIQSNQMMIKDSNFPNISILHNVKRRQYIFSWDSTSRSLDDNLNQFSLPNSMILFNIEFPFLYSELPLDSIISINFYACLFQSSKQKIGTVTKKIFTKNSRRLKTGAYVLSFEDDIKSKSEKMPSNSFINRKNQKSIFRYIRKTSTGKVISYEPYDDSVRRAAGLLHPSDAVQFFASLFNPTEPPKLSENSKFIHISVPSPERNAQIIFNEQPMNPICKDFLEDLYHFSKEQKTKIKKKKLAQIRGIPPLSDIPDEYHPFIKDNIDTFLKDPSLYSALFRSVNWSSQFIKENLTIKIDKLDPIDIEYALEFFTDRFNFPPVRRYAVRCIGNIAKDKEKKKDILLYLPQIIQATKVDETLGLNNILISLAKEDIKFATKLYWLSSFDNDPKIVKMKHDMLNSVDEKSKNEITKQKKLFEDIENLLEIPRPNTPKLQKQEIIKGHLNDMYKQLKSFKEPILSPLNPSIKLLGIDPNEVKVFASNKSPVCLVFNAIDENDDPRNPNIKKIKMMFKIGDDIRQDQLILQLFEIMDKIFKSSELDLCIMTYNILAISSKFGCMEFVENSQAIKDIDDNIEDEALASDNLRKITNSNIENNLLSTTSANRSSTSKILLYLKRDNPDEEDFLKRMDTYTRSLAGFSVMTFVLIIGDRHDNNILVTQDGHFLHIDFGFILGDDAKPLTQPVKIRAEYLLPINTDISAALSKVLNFAGPAFNAVRKHGRLFLTLIELMFHANISCFQGEKNNGISKLKNVQQSLMLNLTEIEAMKELKSTFIDSIKSKLTTLYDTIHSVAMMGK